MDTVTTTINFIKEFYGNMEIISNMIFNSPIAGQVIGGLFILTVLYIIVRISTILASGIVLGLLQVLREVLEAGFDILLRLIQLVYTIVSILSIITWNTLTILMTLLNTPVRGL